MLEFLFQWQQKGIANKCLTALAHTQEGVALFDKVSGTELYSNGAYRHYHLPTGWHIWHTKRHPETGIVQFPAETALDYPPRVRVVDFDQYFAVFVPIESRYLWQREKVLRYLLDFHRLNPNIFTAVTQALGRALGWRWVGVSRFLDSRGLRVRFLGWWDGGEIQSSFDEVLLGSACEKVAAKEAFVFYSDQEALQELFPHWQAVSELGITCYAGIPYHVNGKAFGHIVIMDDQPHAGIDRAVIEDVLQLVNQYMGAHLELQAVRDQADLSYHTARTDPVSHLPNRYAAQEAMTRINHLYDIQQLRDALLIKLSVYFPDFLNGLDEDQFKPCLLSIADMMRRIWRSCDDIFRWNDHTFVIIAKNAKPQNRASLILRLDNELKLLKQAFPSIHYQYRMAYLSEYQGSAEAAFQAISEQLRLLRASNVIHIKNTKRD